MARLDDLAVACVLSQGFRPELLNQSSLTDFDSIRMIRATKLPLGLVYKLKINVGDEAVDGHVALEGEEGSYYGGLHPPSGARGGERGFVSFTPPKQTYLGIFPLVCIISHHTRAKNEPKDS